MPAILDLERVRVALRGLPWHVSYVDETGSTNDDLRPWLDEPGFGRVLVAEHQSAGHGRKGRSWIAPPGSALTFTFVLPRPIAAPALWAVPFWSALALDDGITLATGVTTRLVWPNDVFLDGRKLAGILALSRVSGNSAFAAVGIGLNVRRPPDDEGVAAIEPPPRFLSDAAPQAVREDVLVAILRSASATLGALDDPDTVARAWEVRSHVAGTRYAWRRDDGVEGRGTAERLAADGRLVVAGDDGTTSALDLADVRIIDRG